jgi:hypothetical protein
MTLIFTNANFDLSYSSHIGFDRIDVYNKLTDRGTSFNISQTGLWFHQFSDIKSDSLKGMEFKLDDEAGENQITPEMFRANPLILAGKRVLVKHDRRYYTYDIAVITSTNILWLQPLGRMGIHLDTPLFIEIQNSQWFATPKGWNTTIGKNSSQVTIHLIQP